MEIHNAVNEIIQSLVNLIAYLIPILVPVIVGRVVVWAREAFNEIKNSQPETIRRVLETAAEFGADFAEQIGPGAKLFGQDKLNAAADAAAKWLEHQGYDIDPTLIRQAIETVLFNKRDKYNPQ